MFIYEYHIFLSNNDNKQNKFQPQCIVRIMENNTKNTIYIIEKLLLSSLSIVTISIFFVHSSISG